MPSFISKILPKKSSSSSVGSNNSPTSPTGQPNNSAASSSSPSRKLHKNRPEDLDRSQKHASLPPNSRRGQVDIGVPRRSLDDGAVPPREIDNLSPPDPSSPVFHRRSGDGPRIVTPSRPAPPPPPITDGTPSNRDKDFEHHVQSLFSSPSRDGTRRNLPTQEPEDTGLTTRSMATEPAESAVTPSTSGANPSHQGTQVSQQSNSGILPPGAAPAKPSMHYPQTPSPNDRDSEVTSSSSSLGLNQSPQFSPLAPDQLLSHEPIKRPLAASSQPVKAVPTYQVARNVSEAPRRQSEEADMGYHPPDNRLSSGSSLQMGQNPIYEGRKSAEIPRRSGESSRTSIPDRTSSLGNLLPEGGAQGSVSSFETFGKGLGASTSTPMAGRSREELGNRSPEQLARQVEQLQLRDGDNQGSKTPQEGTSGSSNALEEARADLVGKIVNDAEQRKAKRGDLSDEAKDVFQRAGLENTLTNGSTVDVKTRWIQPVVKEHIIPKEHTEYTTIINRDIHRHHVYPKIQPISDPDPMVLETRHRIFSSATGKWHEVVGDDAARAILGDDLFLNGPREVRTDRKLALPGLTPTDTTGASATRATETSSSEQTQPIDYMGAEKWNDDFDPTEEGYGTGGKGAVEREGVLGEKLGDWKNAARGAFFGRSEGDVGVAM